MPTPMTRRHWTQIAAAAAAAAGCAQPGEASPLIDSPKGDFQFLKGSGPYSSGAVAAPGFEVVHVIFNPLPGLWDTFGIIEKHLKAQGRPLDALCGMELRIPKALSVEGFNEFNQPYIDRLKEWDEGMGHPRRGAEPDRPHQCGSRSGAGRRTLRLRLLLYDAVRL